MDTYAGQRAKGAMLDAIRTASWFPRRSARTTKRYVLPIVDEHDPELGVIDPSLVEAIAAIEISEYAESLTNYERAALAASAEIGGQANMAKRRGVSLSRICQVRTKALDKLRAML